MKKTGKILLLLMTFFITGCQSAKSVYGKGDSSLVVLIVDENNLAVGDYSVVLEGGKRSGSLRTNSQGMCSFTKIGKASYFLSGKKNGYTSLAHIPVQVEKTGSVLCFSVTSEKSVFEKALELYEQDLFIDGLTILDTLCVKPASWSSAALGLYRTVGLLKTNQKTEAKNQLTQTRQFLYEVNGKICRDNNQFLFEGDFINHTELGVKAFTVVFSLCDADGEAVALKRNNIVYKIEKAVSPYSHCEFSIPLKEYYSDELKQEYLYVSQILYADDSLWLDPFGLEVFEGEDA